MSSNKHKNNKTQDNKKQQNQNQNANRDRAEANRNREEIAQEIDFIGNQIQNKKTERIRLLRSFIRLTPIHNRKEVY